MQAANAGGWRCEGRQRDTCCRTSLIHDHQSEIDMPGWTGQGSRHARGYGSDWTRLRAFILRRDSYLCQVCLSQGRASEAKHVDHIKPKSKGGTDDADNLQSICRPCHDAKTTREAAEAQGREVKDRARFDPSGRVIW